MRSNHIIKEKVKDKRQSKSKGERSVQDYNAWGAKPTAQLKRAFIKHLTTIIFKFIHFARTNLKIILIKNQINEHCLISCK